VSCITRGTLKASCKYLHSIYHHIKSSTNILRNHQNFELRFISTIHLFKYLILHHRYLISINLTFKHSYITKKDEQDSVITWGHFMTIKM